MLKPLPIALMVALTVLGAGNSAVAADKADHAKPAASADTQADKDFHLPPFPADAHVSQSAQIDGRALKYTATVGSLPVRDEKGNVIGEVVFTAYTMPGANRPVTFALNGGPGASSVYLNFGAIGPKRVNFGVEGNNPSDPATLHDNP